jgi:transcriptional regulator PpsR
VNRRTSQPADLGALADCAQEVAEAFVSLASDIAIVVDDAGVVTGVAQNPTAPVSIQAEDWVGQRWTETVTSGTRRKIELMLADVALTGVARRREVNVAGDGEEIPIAYTALRLGPRGPVIAVGRDLRAVAAIQQRFLDVQQEMERSYWRARQLESRYRLLFQVATDAVMTVEAQSLRIVEANHSASMLLGGVASPLAGTVAVSLFDPVSRGTVQNLLDGALATAKPAEITARVAGSGASVAVSATPFRARDGMRLLLRLRASSPGAEVSSDLSLALARLVDTTRDGVVVTDSVGRILVANPAFVTMAGAGTEERVRGRSLADWLGRIDGDLAALIAGVHGHGLAQLVRTQLRRSGDRGAIDVDVSAALLTEGEQECFGFTLRESGGTATPPVDERRSRLLEALASLEASLDDRTVPRGELLTQAQQLMHGHLASIALERCGGDSTRAAELLGVDIDEIEALRPVAGTS